MEHFTLGPTPHNEDCAQVGTSEYAVRVRREAKAYIGQLVRMFGAPPPRTEFRLKSFPRDFATYHRRQYSRQVHDILEGFLADAGLE